MSAGAPAPRGSADARLGRNLRFGPVAALVIAALVRLHGLGSRSLWTDEGSTWTAASLPLRALVRRCVERDASPPLYYLLTKCAIAFGDDEAHLRLVSVLASLVLVWLTYRLARLALARNGATFAAVLTALSPYQIMYAQEARTYALVGALLVAGVYAHARLTAGGGRRAWWALVGTTALGLWTQSIAALGVLAQGALAVGTRAGRRRFGPWLGAMVVTGVLYLPWAWYGRGLSEHMASSHWYIEGPDAHGVFKVLRAALLSPLPLVAAPTGSRLHGLADYLPTLLAWLLVALSPVVLLALSVRELRAAGPRGRLARLAWAGWGVPLAAVFLVSLRQPLFIARYFVFVTPFVSVLYALGVTRVRSTPVRLTLCTLLVGLSLFAIARYEHDYTKEPWREVAAQVDAGHGAVPTAVLVTFDVDPFAFYARRMVRPVMEFEVGHPEEPFAAHYTPRQLDELEAQARANTAPYPEVWVVVRSPNSDVRREVARRTQAVAAAGRRLVLHERIESATGGLSVTRYVRDSLATPAPAPVPAPHRGT